MSMSSHSLLTMSTAASSSSSSSSAASMPSNNASHLTQNASVGNYPSLSLCAVSFYQGPSLPAPFMLPPHLAVAAPAPPSPSSSSSSSSSTSVSSITPAVLLSSFSTDQQSESALVASMLSQRAAEQQDRAEATRLLDRLSVEREMQRAQQACRQVEEAERKEKERRELALRERLMKEEEERRRQLQQAHDEEEERKLREEEERVKQQERELLAMKEEIERKRQEKEKKRHSLQHGVLLPELPHAAAVRSDSHSPEPMSMSVSVSVPMEAQVASPPNASAAAAAGMAVPVAAAVSSSSSSSSSSLSVSPVPPSVSRHLPPAVAAPVAVPVAASASADVSALTVKTLQGDHLRAYRAFSEVTGLGALALTSHEAQKQQSMILQLLQLLDWSSDRALTLFFDDPSLESVLEKAKLIDANNKKRKSPAVSSSSSQVVSAPASSSAAASQASSSSSATIPSQVSAANALNQSRPLQPPNNVNNSNIVQLTVQFPPGKSIVIHLLPTDTFWRVYELTSNELASRPDLFLNKNIMITKISPYPQASYREDMFHLSLKDAGLTPTGTVRLDPI